MAMIRSGFPVLAIVPHGPGGHALQPVLHRLIEQHADLWAIGDGNLPPARLSLPLPPAGSEALSPLLAILPLQQFALELARQRGVDPDQPERIQKVTETW